MKTNNKMTMWLVALGLGISMPLAVHAQPFQNGGGGGGAEVTEGGKELRGHKGKRGFRGDRGERHGKMQAMHARLLKEKVGLDDRRVAEVQAVQAQFDAQRQAVREDLKVAQEALRILVDTGSEDTRAYEKAIANAQNARARMHQLRADQQAAIAQLLTPKEQATLMVSMQKVHKHRGMRGGKGGDWKGRKGGGDGEWQGRRGFKRGGGPRGE